MTTLNLIPPDEAFKLDGSHIIVHAKVLVDLAGRDGGDRIRCGSPEAAAETIKMIRGAYIAGGILNPKPDAHERDMGKPAPAKKPKRQSRADRAGELSATIESTKGDVEMLKEELEQWLENMPENLQEGQKAQELQEAVDELENVVSSLDDAQSSLYGVSWPGMF